MPHFTHLFLTGIVLAAVAGCAVSRAPQVLPASSAGINTFALTGRVAVKLEQRGYSAKLTWRHAAASDRIRLLSPVGSVIAELEADASGAMLTTGDKKEYRSDNVQALTREVLGWDLPLEGLQHWVVGRAEPGLPVQAEERDARGRLSSLKQNDWHITFLDYAGDSSLPARIALVYDNLKLRLIIDRWDLAE
ncbi:MAG TPA: lipoprotein insertase outer membrane protein LolB [Burkholderiales bacterium]|nr:lipoprotein insertase outer membrane protein LolB [Burkholderiales bacterium]